MIRNIIFDWSGTLVDDLPAVWQTSNALLERAGRQAMTLPEFRAEFVLPFTLFYDRHAAHVPMAQLEVWFHEEFQKHEASVVELPHARAFLKLCRKRGVRTFLLSSIHPFQFREQAARLGITEDLDHHYVGVRDKRLKIHEILQEHRIEPGATLFIGDMEHDVETARHGGVRSVAVLTGYNKLEQLQASRPDLIVEHLGELHRLLEAQDFNLA